MIPVSEPTETVYRGRPRYEGANIRTWIGFKHFIYLVEEAVLDHFRQLGLGPQACYHRFGLGLTFVESSVQLPRTVEVDDVATLTVRKARARDDGTLRLDVRLTVERPGGSEIALRGWVRVALVREKDAPGQEPVPAEYEPFVVPEIGALPKGADAQQQQQPSSERNAFTWSWRVPYFYCHFSDRLQHSGYVRMMEEAVDRFLADRGLSVRTLLDERGWIPVVSRARIRLLADVHMEETVQTVMVVDEIIKNAMFSARIDCYVRRADRLVHTATGRILHGYAVSRGPDAGQLAILDAATRSALMGDGPSESLDGDKA